MEHENQRVVLTKRLLKESMLQLLKEKEPDKINVTELCRAAEINRATFYRHYDIPRDVLMDIQKDIFYELQRQVPLPKGADGLKITIDRMCRFMEENADLLRIIIRCNSDTDFINFVSDIYMEVWKEFRHMDILKNLDDEDGKLLAMYSAGGSYFILRSWMLGNIQKNAAEMADYVYELLNKTDFLSFRTLLGIPTKP